MQLIEKRPWIVVLAVCLILYFQNAWVPGMFHDGYLYVAFGKNAAEKGHWLIPYLSDTEYPRFDQHPPLYFILEGIWFKIFKFSWTSARIYGLMWMLAAALAFFHLLKEKFNQKLAMSSSIILLLMPSLLKKSRFPNMDFPLLLFTILIMLSLVKAPKEKLGKTWSLIGLCGGLALLIKGAGALYLLGIVGLYLLLSKEDREQLKTPWPYLGLLLSFILFSLWPIALYIKGESIIFKGYLSGQVLGSVVKGRNLKEVDYFMYFTHLLKTTIPWILLGLWKVKEMKVKEKSLFLLSSVWLFLPLFVFSLMKVKYSNYLIPLYPAIAIFAGYALTQLSDTAFKKIKSFVGYTLTLFAFIILIFPLTNKSRRHVETFEIMKELKAKNLKPTDIVFVNNSYEYYSTVSLFSIFYGANPHRTEIEDYSDTMLKTKNALLFFPTGIRPKEWNEYGYIKIKEFPKKNLEVFYAK